MISPLLSRSRQPLDRLRRAFVSSPFRTLRKGFVAALALVLVGLTCWQLSHRASVLQDSAAAVNLSGKQRMLTQRAALLATQMQHAGAAEQPALSAELQRTVQGLQEAHTALTGAPSELELNHLPSPAEKTIYYGANYGLAAELQNYLGLLRAYLAQPNSELLQQINDAALYSSLLPALDAVVSQIEHQAELQKIHTDRVLTGLWIAAAICVCLLLYDLLPKTRRLRDAEEQARIAAEQTRLVVQHTKDYSILTLDPEGHVTSWNAGAERIKGYREEEIRGRHFSCFYPQEALERGRPYQELRLALSKGRLEDEGWRVRKDGSKFWANVVIAPISDSQGTLIGFSQITRDLTKQRRNESFLNTAIESLPTAAVMVDNSGDIVLVNCAAETMFGYSRSELLGEPVEILLPERFREEHTSSRTRYLANPTTTPMRDRKLFGQRRDGTEFPVEVGLNPVLIDDKFYALSTIGDISAREEVLAELRESQAQALAASRAKSRFLANMSHEIRTPMNAIIGLTERVLASDLDETQRDYLATVDSSANALLDIINDLLDFSKIEAGKLRLEKNVIHLQDLLGDSLKSLALYASQKDIELTYRIAADVPYVVLGDTTRLRQILTNLVGNAVKFTEKGEIKLEVSLAEPPGDDHSPWQLLFTLTDTGIGIPTEKLSAIFDAFEQVDSSPSRRYGGTGLGLSITARLIERMNGRIWVESELHRGSTFSFVLPFGRTTEPSHQSWQKAIQKLENTPLLIVDDNATNRLILEELVRTQGMLPTLTPDAPTALRLLKEAATADRPYRLVISDVNMPEMDGYTLVEEIRQHPELFGTPVIVMASSGDAKNLSEINQLDIAARLMKPVKPSELFDAVIKSCGIAEVTSSSQVVSDSVNIAQERDSSPLSNLDILLAEDSIPNQKLALAILGDYGHRTVVAGTGRKALEALASQEFDLVLMDIQMPELDGVATTVAIRESEQERGEHIPIVALTAYALSGDRERYLQAGMDAYVSKPIRPEELWKAMREAIDVAAAWKAAGVSPADRDPGVCIPWEELLATLRGNEEALNEITESYRTEIETMLPNIRRALQEHDRAELVKSAHRIKSSLAYFRLHELAGMANELEQLGEAEQIQTGAEMFIDFETGVAAILPLLEFRGCCESPGRTSPQPSTPGAAEATSA